MRAEQGDRLSLLHDEANAFQRWAGGGLEWLQKRAKSTPRGRIIFFQLLHDDRCSFWHSVLIACLERKHNISAASAPYRSGSQSGETEVTIDLRKSAS